VAVRLGRSERYGRLTCGRCTERQRDEFRCVLKGHERTPAEVPTYRVDMGRDARAHLTRSCPVGLALTDSTARLLSAYGLAKRWGQFPPGRRDPQLLEAFSVIQREHDTIDLEQTAPSAPDA
jgi:hypothetical protein